MCQCCNNKACVRKIHTTKEGRMYVKENEHLSCGKVQKQIKELLSFLNQLPTDPEII